jgi:bacterioferritin-associated ferredoxin
VDECGTTGTPSVVICRCEGATREQIDAAIEAGASSLDDLKRRTLAGMGLCQGVYCLDEMARMLARKAGIDLAQVMPMTCRPPVGGVRLAALAKTVGRDD